MRFWDLSFLYSFPVSFPVKVIFKHFYPLPLTGGAGCMYTLTRWSEQTYNPLERQPLTETSLFSSAKGQQQDLLIERASMRVTCESIEEWA